MFSGAAGRGSRVKKILVGEPPVRVPGKMPYLTRFLSEPTRQKCPLLAEVVRGASSFLGCLPPHRLARCRRRFPTHLRRPILAICRCAGEYQPRHGAALEYPGVRRPLDREAPDSMGAFYRLVVSVEARQRGEALRRRAISLRSLATVPHVPLLQSCTSYYRGGAQLSILYVRVQTHWAGT